MYLLHRNICAVMLQTVMRLSERGTRLERDESRWGAIAVVGWISLSSFELNLFISQCLDACFR